MKHTEAKRIIRKVRQNYNTIARDWHRSRQKPSGVKVKVLAGIKKNDSVLDLGCGNGLMVPEVIKRGGQYTGLDISKKLLALAKKKFKKVKFILGQANDLPFKKNSFDFVFSFAVMHHIPSPEFRRGFLKEIYRVLNPSGRAVIINWNLLNTWADKRFKIKEQLAHQHPGLEVNDVFVPWKATKGKSINRYFHIFTKLEILALAKTAGFKKCSAEFYNRAGVKEKNGEELVLKLIK